MYAEASDSKTESYSLNPKPPSSTLRSSITLPIYRSWSVNSSDSSGGERRSYRISLDTKTIVNKLVLDIRKSVYRNNIFKPFNKQSHTNEVYGCACFLFCQNHSYLFLNNNNLNQFIFSFIAYPTTSIHW